MKNKFLFLVFSFVAGFCLMTVELAASRIVAPYVGSSIYTWTSVIGVILAGLSLGYYLGGYLSDKFTSINVIFWECLFSALSVTAVPFILPLVKSIALSSLPIFLIIFLISFILFFLPSVFLGTLSPSILKKYVSSLGQLAQSAGTISALWSLGSIIGTFMTGFVFIGYIGSRETFLAVGIIIALGALLFSNSKKQILLSVLVLILSLFLLFLLPKVDVFNSKNIIFSKESNYYQIKVANGSYGEDDNVRILFLDFDSHSVESLSDKFLEIYQDAYPLFSVFNQNIKDILTIGGGSYSMAKDFSVYYPNSSVDVIELDGEVKRVAEDYFDLKNYKVNTLIGDARMVLSKDFKKYDLIFEDAFNSFISVPWHLTTLEFSQLAKEHLKENGIYAVNFISALKGSEADFFKSMLKTFKLVFPNFYIFSSGGSYYSPQNIFLIGINSNSHQEIGLLKLKASFLQNGNWFYQNLYDSKEFSDQGGIVLKDNFAPVEKLMIPMINKYFNFYSKFYYSFLSQKI